MIRLPPRSECAETVPPASAIIVCPARTRAERDAFIRLPWALYRGDRYWVPPLIREQRAFLDPTKNPVFDHVTIELFVALRNGRIVGRIAAADDTLYRAVQDASVGSFGFYESVNDLDVASRLFDAARAWARRRGLAALIGPLNPTINHETGLLVEGFDAAPAVLTTYNAPYYASLFAACGLEPAKDLWGWQLRPDDPVPERVVRIAERARARTGVVVRSVTRDGLRADVPVLREIFNAAWADNWGFVPMTEAEAERLASDLRRVLVPGLSLIAEVGGEPVGMAITIPDVNQAIRVANGRLTTCGLPIGYARLLWALRKIDGLRLTVLGVRPAYRHRGIDSVMTVETMRHAQRLGYRSWEVSWTLEDNIEVNRAVQAFGARRHKIWRVYTLAA